MTPPEPSAGQEGADGPLSVVVPTRDRPHLLEGCLAALRAAAGPEDQVIVVDSCSRGPETAELAARYGFGLVRCDRPGASRARNAGWRAARHGVVAFVDDDVRVGPGWADGLRAAAGSHPEASFFTGRLGVAPDDHGGERPVAVFDEAEGFSIDAGVLVDFGHGANLAVRRPALEAVGGFDEQFGPGARWRAAEDLDLVDRLLRRGLDGRYVPAAAATHVQWRRRPDFVRLEWTYGIGQGARLARLRRADPGRYRPLARIAWRDQGLRLVPGLVRNHYEFGLLLTGVRLAGTAAGHAGFSLARLGRRGAAPEPP